MSPKEIVHRATVTNEIAFHPPQLYLVGELVGYRKWEELAPGRNGWGHPTIAGRNIVQFEAELRRGEKFRIPGQGGREVGVWHLMNNDSEPRYVKGTKHRIFGDYVGRNFVVVGVERRGMERYLGAGWEDFEAGFVPVPGRSTG